MATKTDNNIDIVSERKALAAKSGKRAEKAEKPEPKKAPAKKAVTKKASKAAKPSTGKSGKAKDAEVRLTWAPQPVENARWYVAQTASNYEKR
ncbi:MAG: hypothetical protein EON60_13145, partial [Alphaproteobacteria bacterium]